MAAYREAGVSADGKRAKRTYDDERSPTGETTVEVDGRYAILPDGQKVKAGQYFDPYGRGQNDGRFLSALRDSQEREGQTYEQYQGAREQQQNAGTAISTYTPVNLQGVSGDALRQVQAGATAGFRTGLDDFNSEHLGGVQIDPRLSSGTSRSASFSAGDVSGFDPEGALRRYAEGAWSDAQMDLGRLLEEQEAASQRGGRLNSGFFDRDNGRVITDVTSRFGNDLAQQALNAAGIKGDMLARGAQLRLSAAQSADDNDLRGRTTALNAALERAGQMDANRLSALQSSSRDRLNAAEFQDQFGLDRERLASDLDFDRASQLDHLGLDALSRGADVYGDVASRDANLYDSEANRTRDQLVGFDDRDMLRRGFKAQQKQNRYQNLLGGVQTAIDLGSMFFGGGGG